MNDTIAPLRFSSLKDSCIAWLEQLILSGELKAGERLPSERDLAARLDISRPVLHEALVDLAAKGLVTILPRRGVVINDFRKAGSIAIISSLLMYNQGKLDPRLIVSLFQMRILLETETARLAAVVASADEIAGLKAVLEQEHALDPADVSNRVQLDFEFHLLVSIASGNLIYPLIINSFQSIYTHFTGDFYRHAALSAEIQAVYAFQGQLINALEGRDAACAADTMYRMLLHGEQYIKGAGL